MMEKESSEVAKKLKFTPCTVAKKFGNRDEMRRKPVVNPYMYKEERP